MKKILLFFLLLSIASPLLAQTNANGYYESCMWNYNGTITNGMKIKTNLPVIDGSQMPTIRIEGYNYGAAQVIGLNLVYYVYNNGNFINTSISNWGNYQPKITLANENDKVVIYIHDKPYYARFKVTTIAQGMGETSAQLTNWQIVDEPLTPKANTAPKELSYSTGGLYESCMWNYNGTITNGMKIKTNLPYMNSSQMPTIRIEGYNYGSAQSIGLNLSYYIYENNFIQTTISNWGNYQPKITLANENDKVVIYIHDKPYFARFKVTTIAQGMGAETVTNLTNWQVVDEPLTPKANTTPKVLLYQQPDQSIGGDEYYNLYNSSGYGGISWFSKVNPSNSTQYLSTHASVYSSVLRRENTALNYYVADNVAPIGSALTMKNVFNIQNSGNVGIGTASPTEKLQVAEGNIHLPYSSTNTGALVGVGTSTEKFTNDGVVIPQYGLKWASSTSVPGAPSFFLSSFGGVRMFTGGSERFRINSNGDVGIGISPTTYKLTMNSTSGAGLLSYTQNSTFATPSCLLSSNGIEAIITPHIEANDNKVSIGSWTAHPVTFRVQNVERVRIMTNGDMGIGTASPRTKLDINGNVAIGMPTDKAYPSNYKLAVGGNALAEKMVVKLQTNWPDYVFHSDYALPPLSQVEEHIKAKGHLPNIPTEKEVKETGIDLGDMNAKLLQKIEELTLYLIEIKKQNEVIIKENTALNSKIVNLQKEMTDLKSKK